MKSHRTTSEKAKASRRIAFACDVLRLEVSGTACVNFQPHNLVWMRELLTPGLRAADPTVSLIDVFGPRSTADLAELMGGTSTVNEYRQDPAMAWASRYDSIDTPSVDWYVDQLCESDLVIGFELPPAIKRGIHARGHRYLNLCIHPLRFLRDLCFGATTNDPAILAALRTTVIDGSEVTRQVHRYRALFQRRQVEACAIPQGLPVLVGQTAKDSVLINKGRFADWADYLAALRSQLAAFDALVFLEHPMRPTSTFVTEGLRSSLGKTVISTNANGYGVLLSNIGIPEVITLSSSLGAEAQAIGLKTTFLLADPREKFVVADCDLTNSAPCGHALLGSRFWAQALGFGTARSESSDVLADDFFLGEHYVRNSLDAWSFRALQFGLDLAPARKSLIPAERLTAARRDELIGGLLGYAAAPVAPGVALQRARVSGLQLEFLDPPLEIDEHRGVALAGPAGATYFATGFHAPEAWGSWSSAIHSSIAFPVATSAVEVGTSLCIRLRLRIYDGLLPSAPVLRLSHAGRAVGYVFFRPGMPPGHDIEVQLPVESSLVLLDFELTGLASPAVRGESGDTRWLGFAVHDIEVSCLRGVSGTQPEPQRAAMNLWGVAREARACLSDQSIA